MADFKQAVEWMKEGINVRRKYWLNESYYIYLSENGFWHKDGNVEFKHNFCMSDFKGDDWEIYEEKKLNYLEKIKDSLIHIKKFGEIPELIIINEEDSNKIVKEEMIGKSHEERITHIHGIKVLIIPEYLRDDTFLTEGKVFVITEEGFKGLKEVLKNYFYKS